LVSITTGRKQLPIEKENRTMALGGAQAGNPVKGGGKLVKKHGGVYGRIIEKPSAKKEKLQRGASGGETVPKAGALTMLKEVICQTPTKKMGLLAGKRTP